MSDVFTIHVDNSEILRAFDLLGELAEAYAKEAAMETAEAIDNDATARVRRRQGQTAVNIVHTDHMPLYLGGEPSFNRTAAFVYVEAIRRPANLPLWLEFGTRYSGPHPFLFEAAELQQGQHIRRLSEQMQRACDEAGHGR